MESWVFIFSQFTDEALAIEALTICVLTAGYAVFWAFRKRRVGSTPETVPSTLVRAHLNELIEEAKILRTQMFGLLADQGGAVASSGPSLTAAVVAPEMSSGAVVSAANDGTLKALEEKLNQQSQATQTLQDQKAKLEAELAGLKAAGAPSASASSDGGNAAQVQSLEKKVKDLEEKLAEYNIIEDDLANLKRLQQENAQLKAALEKSGAPAPVAVAAPVVEAAPAPAFEQVVDQVEKAMEAPAEVQPAPAKAEPAPAPVAAAPQAAAPAATTGAPAAKNDEDLLAEFEKMLNL